MPVFDGSREPRGGGSGPLGSAPAALIEKRRLRRDLGLGWFLASTVVIAAASALLVFTQTKPLEDSLRRSSESALSEAGLSGIALSVNGRIVTARVPVGQSTKQVGKVLSGVPGVSSVFTTDAYASKTEAKACGALSGRLQVLTNKQSIPFQGNTARLTGSGESMVRAAAAALKDCQPAHVVVGGHSDHGTPNGSALSLDRARAIESVLRREGIVASRITTLGYGDQFPKSNGTSAAARQANERGSIEVEER